MSSKVTNSPLITVAIAVYNNADNVEEMLQCIERQTYTNIEILCVDDCSKDNSMDIVRRQAALDSRYRIIEKSQNAGLSDTRNISLKEAKGEYIYFCDADDVCAPDMLEKAVVKAESEHADLVIWDYYEFGVPIYKLIEKESPSRLAERPSRKELVHWGAFMWTHLFRTESLRKIGIPFPLGRTKQDLPVHWAACIQFDKITVISKRLYGYRISQSQTSRKKGRVLLDFIYVHDYLKEYLERNGLFDEYKEDFYQSLCGAMYSVWLSIQDEYKEELLEMCKQRYCADLKYSVGKCGWSIKTFASWLGGNRLSGMKLRFRLYAENMYRKFFKK